jgi:hypothetical protein
LVDQLSNTPFSAGVIVQGPFRLIQQTFLKKQHAEPQIVAMRNGISISPFNN